ncbi:MAG: hypothetical protein KJP03_02665, partial [Gammaproteobacteria bacterium]|nr:hypothetical protein [Gammaproteobacteria bacterium]
MMKSRQLRICVALSACSLCSGAMAGSWEMFPTVQSGVSYNDNPALEPESQIRGQDRATTYLFGLAEADFVKAEPSYTVTVSPRVRHLEYPDSDFEQLSRTDYYLRGDATKVAPLHSLSLSASYDRLNVLSAEDYSPGDDIGGGGSDFEDLDDIRERYRISPSFNWSLTQKDSVSAAASFTITDHKLEDTARPRADIDSLSWSLQYLRSITPRQSLGFFLSGADSDSERPGATGTCADGFDLVPDFTMDVFCPDVPAGLTPEEYAVIRAIYPYGVADAEFLTESETTTYNLSWRYQWSENTRLDLNFGQQDTTSKSTTVAFGGPAFTQDLGFDGRNYSLNLTNAGQRYRFELSASRGVTTQT